MRKPTRPPPPPPSRRCQSPANSCHSLPRQYSGFQAGSDYAESCISMPYSTRSLQPPVRTGSPVGSCYYSCRSESGSCMAYSPRCCSHSCYASGGGGAGNWTPSTCDIQSHCCSNSVASCRCSMAINPTVSHHSPRTHSPCTSFQGHHSPRLDSRIGGCHACSPSHMHPGMRPVSHNLCGEHRPCEAICNRQKLTALRELRSSLNNHTHSNDNFHHNGGAPDQPDSPHVLRPTSSRVQLSTSQLAMKPLPPDPPKQLIPPVPRERASLKPQRSISPLPELRPQKLDPSGYRRNKYHHWCEPSYFRQYLLQFLERLFKYREGREARRAQCEEAEALSKKEAENAGREFDPQRWKTEVYDIWTIKETRYLRSLRAPITKDDFRILTEIGRGFIGQVSLVEKISHDVTMEEPKLYAMKKLNKKQVFKGDHMAHVMAERDILAEADNEWIVKLYFSFQDRDNLYFILEYIPGGDLMNLLCHYNVFPEEWARFYIAEISLALQFVHDMNFIHRDIKPDNILIDAAGHIKLTDFGLCTGFRLTHEISFYKEDTHIASNGASSQSPGSLRGLANNPSGDQLDLIETLEQRQKEQLYKKRTYSLVGSPNYIAPEVIRRNYCAIDRSFERLCDWWSVGVILYEMVVGYCPFIDLQKLKEGTYDPRAEKPSEVQNRIVNWQQYLTFPPVDDPNSPLFIPDLNGIQYPISERTKDLILGLLCEPSDRLCKNGIKDIMKHPFFEGIDWKEIRKETAPHIPELSNEYDTRHFGQIPSQPHGETINGSGTVTKLSMNDFTYRTFWTNHPKDYKKRDAKMGSQNGDKEDKQVVTNEECG